MPNIERGFNPEEQKNKVESPQDLDAAAAKDAVDDAPSLKELIASREKMLADEDADKVASLQELIRKADLNAMSEKIGSDPVGKQIELDKMKKKMDENAANPAEGLK